MLTIQNKLKKPTIKLIESLYKAHLKMVMTKEDNILTVILVSKDCKIIKQTNKIL